MTLESLGMFSRVEPDPVGEFLGTGFERFETPFGLGGLAKIRGEAMEILAVQALNKRRGAFRNFIAQAKKRVSAIYVLEDWNPIIGDALNRYGFTRFNRTEPDGERISGWKWQEPKS